MPKTLIDDIYIWCFTKSTLATLLNYLRVQCSLQFEKQNTIILISNNSYDILECILRLQPRGIWLFLNFEILFPLPNKIKCF